MAAVRASAVRVGSLVDFELLLAFAVRYIPAVGLTAGAACRMLWALQPAQVQLELGLDHHLDCRIIHPLPSMHNQQPTRSASEQRAYQSREAGLVEGKLSGCAMTGSSAYHASWM